MATATRSPLVEQAEKIDRLAQHLSNGHLLEKVIRLAGSDTVWAGPVRDGFMNWAQHALDFWVRNQLAQGLRLVARSLFDRAAAIEQAAKQMIDTGQVGIVALPPPAPLNYAPGTPPSYGDIGGGQTSTFNSTEMRNLSHLLLATADEVMDFGRTIDQALDPPPAPPPPPGAPPPVNPVPPDAAAAAGFPQVYIEIANQLRNASLDIGKRVDALVAFEEPLASTPMDLNLVETAASGAASLVSSSDAAAQQASAADTPTGTPGDVVSPPSDEKPPPTQEQIDAARDAGTTLAEEALRKDVLNHPDELKKISDELAQHKDDPAAEAHAAAFVEKFGARRMLEVPRTLQAWQNGYSDSDPGTVRPPKKSLPYNEPKSEPKPSDVEDVLFSFSATLATSTHHEGSPKLEEELKGLADAEQDPLALSWLLTNRDADFDADFLCDAFDRGVKQVIEIEAREGKPFPDLTGGEIGLEIEGGRRLDRNPKVAVLNAISRNDEAAARLQTEFQPFTLKVYHDTSEVRIDSIAELLYQGGEYGGYGDNGAALGRMLNTTHRALCNRGDHEQAKKLVDDILRSSTNDKEVKRAQPFLAEIGARHPTDGPAAQAALDRLRRDPKHPARELLLGQMAQVHETAKGFAEAAAAASKNKVKEGKSPELRSIRETEDAWNVIPTLERDPSTANLAQTITEQGIRDAAKGELSDEARRGLAKAISSDSAGFAKSVTALLSAPKGAEAKAHAPELEGIHITADEFAGAVADLMHDPEAKRTIEAGAGNLTGSWAGQAAASHIDALLGKPWEPLRRQALAQQSKELGNYLCAVIKAETKAAENKAQAAIDALTGMRIGANIFSMGLDFASGFLPGGKIASATGKFLFDKAVDIGKGGTGIEGLPLGLEGGLSSVMDDEVKSQEDAAWTQAKLEVADALPIAREFVRDSVAGGLIQQALLLSSPDQERALEQFGVSKTGIGDAGLLDANGRVRIPLPGTAEYTKYTDYLTNNPSLGGAITEAGEGVADNFTDCMNTALLLKSTGKSWIVGPFPQ